MSFLALRSVWVILAVAFGTEEPAGPSSKEAPPATKTSRHFVIQVKLVEVDESGRETLLAEPRLKTTGGNAGISVDHPDGRRFEFTVRMTDRLAAGDELIPARSTVASPADSMLKKLDQKIDLDVKRQTRKDVLRQIGKHSGITIAIDPDIARSTLDQMDSMIDLKMKDEAVADVLNRVIEPMNLEFTIRHEAVLISTSDKLLPAPEDFVVKTYNVADLLRSRDPEEERAELRALISRIKTGVIPASWDRKESAATAQPFYSTKSIVVRQTAIGHAGIQRLLGKVRLDEPRTITE